MRDSLKPYFRHWARAFRASDQTGHELEKITGVEPGEVEQWEKGELLPSEEAVLRLCQYTHQTIDQMLSPFLPPAGDTNQNLRGRVCRHCAKSFRGGPRAWYCPDCRIERRRMHDRMAQERKKRGMVREIGSTDICERCGKEYTVTGGLQKYCPDCAPIAIAENDREGGLEFYYKNKHIINPVRAQKKREQTAIKQVEKSWSLLAPDGAIYRAIDLKSWCLENAELLGGQPQNAHVGFTAIRASYKRGDFGWQTWHGWTLIEDGKPVTEWATEKNRARAQEQRARAKKLDAEAKNKQEPDYNWVLLAPDGTVYRVKGLLAWCFANYDLLDGVPKTAWNAFRQIRYYFNNKTFKYRAWRGWTLIEDGKPVTEWAEKYKPSPDYGWTLRAPDGTIYRVKELRGWCLDHADLLDGMPETACRAFREIRYCYKNKSFSHRTWHKWTLVEDGKPVTEWAELSDRK